MRFKKSDIETEWFYFSQILNFENISISLISSKNKFSDCVIGKADAKCHCFTKQ